MTNPRLSGRPFLPLLIVFGIVTAVLLLARKPLLEWNISTAVVIWGNIILFSVSTLSLLLYQRAMAHPTTMGFLRHTYSGIFLKLLACVFALLLYLLSSKGPVNKLGLLVCVCLYFVYTLLELRSLMQWNKTRRNA